MSTRCIVLWLILFNAFCLKGRELDGAMRSGSGPALPPVYIRLGSGDPVYAGRSGGVAARFERTGITLRSPEGLVRMRFAGANPDVELRGESQSETAVHILRGNDEAAWQRNLPVYAQLAYHALYPGIDLVYGNDRRYLKSQFVVAPNADPAAIAIEYLDTHLELTPGGDLLIRTVDGAIRESKPVAWQPSSGDLLPVQAEFVLLGGSTVGFRLGDYQRSLPLVIDPAISFSTFIAGTRTDLATGVALDAAGNAWVTGYSDSPDLPVTSAIQRSSAGSNDAFVAKFDGTTGALLVLTYLGGSSDDKAFAIAVGPDGSPVIAGATTSQNFPARAAVQSYNRGYRNAFAAKLTAAGDNFVYSTYLGGSTVNSDWGYGVAVDPTGQACIVGEASSSDFPLKSPLQATLKGTTDAFLTVLGNTGSLVMSTYFGGTNDDKALAVAFDSSGLYVGGGTFSSDLPLKSAFQSVKGSGEDGFVARFSLNAGVAALVYATYLGGSGGNSAIPERVYSIAVDAGMNAYAAGTTNSVDFPTVLPYQASLGGGTDAFLTKFGPGGTVLFNTYLGGNADELGVSVALNSAGAPYVAGKTDSSYFPVVKPLQAQKAGMSDVFVARLAADGSTLDFSTYIGGGANDLGKGIAVHNSSVIWVVGQSSSTDYPIVGSSTKTLSAYSEAFVTRLSVGANSPPDAVSVSPSSGSGSQQAFTYVFSDADSFSDLAWLYGVVDAAASSAHSCMWRYNRAANLLALVNDAGSSYLAGLIPGSNLTLQNSQCSIAMSGVAVSGSGQALTLTLPITFLPAFAGTKKHSLFAQDSSGATMPSMLQKGTWTVPGTAGAPQAVSVTPNSGRGNSATFVYTASHGDGAAALRHLYGIFDTKVATSGTCFWRYDTVPQSLWLLDDTGSRYLGPITPGGSQALSNSQCALGSSFSVTANGTTLALSLPVTFTGSMSGAKTLFFDAEDGSKCTGYQARGSWTVAGLPPAAVSVAGAGPDSAQQNLVFTFRDPNGYADLVTLYSILARKLTSTFSCEWKYIAASRGLYLLDDTASTWLGPVAPGSASTLQNSQCTVGGTAFAVSGAGTDLTITLPTHFLHPGNSNFYLYAEDSGGNNSGWQTLSTWAVPGAQPPQADAVTPSSGTGSGALFSFNFSDGNGAGDLMTINGLFQAGTSLVNACMWKLDRNWNRLYLLNDAASAYLGPVTPGSSATLENNQCKITADAMVSQSGNSLAVTMTVAFKAAFAGSKAVYLDAVDYAGSDTGWLSRGAWTVP